MKQTELSKEQQACIGGLDRDMLVSAGAGSGKTRVLVERYIAILNKNRATESEVAAITFTEKAAAEMETRIREALGRPLKTAWISTIHSFCARLLRENAVEAGIDPAFSALDEAGSAIFADRQVFEFLERQSRAGSEGVKKLLVLYGARTLAGMLLAAYEKRPLLSKALRGDKHDVPELCGGFLGAFREFHREFEAKKTQEGVLDFDDLLIRTEGLLLTKESVLDRVRAKFKFIMVDEFQDIDAVQEHIIRLISGGKHQNRFVVGDANQSIYGFRDSDVSLFAGTQESIVSSGGAIREITTCYRTAREGIDFLNHFFQKVLDGGDDVTREYETKYQAMKAPENGAAGFRVEFLKVNQEEKIGESRRNEAAAIAGRIAELVISGKYRFRQFAILFRAMSDVNLYERALAAKNVPFYTVAGGGFYVRQEVNDVLNVLKAITGGSCADEVALAGALRSPVFSLSDEALYHLSCGAKLSGILDHSSLPEAYMEKLGKEYGPAAAAAAKLREWRSLSEKVPLTELIGEILDSTGYSASVFAGRNGKQKLSNLFKLRELARQFQQERVLMLRDFVDYVGKVMEKEVRESEAQVETEMDDTVKLMTIHKAKGLEFDVVIIPDIARRGHRGSRDVIITPGPRVAIKPPEGGRYPKDTEHFKKAEAELKLREDAESKRVMYVAMTRAKKHIIFSASLGKTVSAGGWYRMFMDALGGEGSLSYTAPDGTRVPLEIAGAGEARAKLAPREKGSGKFSPRGAVGRIMPIAAETLLKRITVTQITSYMGCPRRFYYRHIMGISEPGNGSGDTAFPEVLNAAARGTIVHSILSDSDYRTLPQADYVTAMIENMAPGMGEKQVQQAVAGVMSDMSRFLSTALAGEVARSNRESEVPFFMNLRDSVVEGKIDLVYYTGKKAVVVDYKTDRDGGMKERDGYGGYFLQLRLYALCLRSAGVNVGESFLYFLESDRRVNVDITGNSLEKAREESEAIIDRIRRSEFPRCSDGCRNCPYGLLCA